MKKVIVVGAGILGASTAYQLAKLGADVLIVDRNDSGQATDAAAGIICPWLSQRRNQAWYRLVREGARYYPKLIQELTSEGETDTGYARVGALCIHDDVDKLRMMEERAYSRKEDAPEVGNITPLNETETRKRFPLLAGGYHSVHISGAARVDGRALRDALLRSAQRNGAAMIQGDAVLQYKSKRVTGVMVGDESFASDIVIVCAGAWANPLFKPLSLHFQISYQKAQIMHLHVPDQQDTGSWPLIMPPTDQYMLAFNQQKIVIGATHENEVEGYDTRVTAGGMQEVLNKGLTLAPALANCTVQEVRVGFRPFTPGYLPVIGAVPGWEGLLTANGLGSSGLTAGPYLGSQLAKMALNMELDINLEDYDIRKAIGENEIK
ncbi:FAD-binding oxidoreductase [Paenibacillus alvei]|uniref:FAD-binding oxidoreductase n=1 Tax=Paenibacillus alvei TaxID=44250 RepID=A0ABT4GW20_PAEAL|nr:FAD-dependent oxidoreductase [Paenibacillus alvei]EJW15217.1 oxidoreductase, DadA family [Paenibacillus alvei DSM 29]MCY9544264.1 FAD-binding oxidoreductase [Paenibacillus alvei]MCY9702872.1 FAD-binding oxidoreductase [Paenibacillus alvei]MCY9733187.1 FAD-binding oxidoreductase [Paenibacillus alvei]MCY9760900.1 FAD-binding oxidoreductase [Paenibacillus alvei]